MPITNLIRSLLGRKPPYQPDVVIFTRRRPPDDVRHPLPITLFQFRLPRRKQDRRER